MLIQTVCLLCSLFILVSPAPFENEIRARENEKEESLPPIMFAEPKRSEKEFPEREENRVRDEEENREEAERELSGKSEHPFNDKNPEEFFRRLESELAMKLAERESQREENGKNSVSSDWELVGRDVPEQDEEMFEEKDARELVEENEMERFNRELKREMEEKLARELAEEEEEKEEREFPEGDEERSEREEHKENPPLKEGYTGEKREEEESRFTEEEMNFRRMLADPSDKIPESEELFDEHQGDLSTRAEHPPKHMRELEAEREQERFDHHGNKEREREELRARQRQRALEHGRKFHEREMEGRKHHQEIGSHGARREERERFRIRSREE